MATEQWPAASGLKHLFRLAVGLAISAVPVLPAMPSEYRLDVGDVLELSIVGTPELRHRIPVDFNGEASFPLIGGIHVAGMSLSQLRSDVEELLAQKVYKNRNLGGPDFGQVIEADEVMLYVAEYRPVYLTGDITQPGEIAYRPGLTVRQAISMAGGYGILRSRERVSSLEVLDLQNEHDTLAIELAKEAAHIWRLETMLGRAVEADLSELPSIDPVVLTEIVGLEKKQLEAYQDAYESKKALLESAIEHADQRIATLSAQLKNEEEGAVSDARDMERVNELHRRGVVPMNRVTEMRRATLLASSRALETSVAAEDAKKEREELRSELQLLDEFRRVELLQELDVANANLELLRKKLQGVQVKMLAVGAIRRGQLQERDGEAQIVVFRNQAQQKIRLVADPDLDLLPGDVVEVTLPIGFSDRLDAEELSLTE